MMDLQPAMLELGHPISYIYIYILYLCVCARSNPKLGSSLALETWDNTLLENDLKSNMHQHICLKSVQVSTDACD